MKTIHDKALLMQFIEESALPTLLSHYGQYKPYLSLVKFHKNELIYDEIENIPYLHFLVRGKLKVCSLLSNGKVHLVHFYTSFEVLGDLELFNMANPFTSIRAATESVCIALSLEETRHLLYQDALFLRYLCETLCRKLCRSANNNAVSVHYPVESRLAGYILAVSEPRPSGGRPVFHENLTETAELLGTSYRHLQRTLKSLLDRSILTRGVRGYEIIDQTRLAGLSGDQFM